MRLLLDAHVPAAVGRELRKHRIDADHLSDWLGGDFRSAADEDILIAALAEGRVLVTYDLQTIPTLLTGFSESGQRHAGVILVNRQSIRSNDVGKIVDAIRIVVGQQSHESWKNRVLFLRKG